MHTHSPNKPKKFKQTLLVCQRADGNCFRDRNADGGIHATRDTIPSEVYYKTQNCLGSFRTKVWNADIRCSAPLTAGHIRALLGHFNWELFDQPPHISDIAASDYHIFTYLKNRLG
jgi:hypothetical protein